MVKRKTPRVPGANVAPLGRGKGGFDRTGNPRFIEGVGPDRIDGRRFDELLGGGHSK